MGKTKFEKGGVRPIIKDELNQDDMWDGEFIYVPEKRINKVALGSAWQDFIGILLTNGYEVTAKCNDDMDIEITWKDKVKPDIEEEIKAEVKKIKEMLR